jgi:hypothetical protein
MLGRDSKEDKLPGGVDERRGTWERVVFGGGCVTDVLLFSAISFEDVPGIATQGKPALLTGSACRRSLSAMLNWVTR